MSTPKQQAADRLAAGVKNLLRDFYKAEATEEIRPTVLPGGDSRNHRIPDTDSMVRWDAEPVFQFCDEVDGLTVLQELGDELADTRRAIEHIRRYLYAAVVAIRQQHGTRPAAIVRESSLSPATVYSVMEQNGVSPVVRDEPAGLVHCEVAENGCNNPAGYRTGGGIADGPEPACPPDQTCQHCNRVMCTACTAATGLCVACVIDHGKRPTEEES